MNVTIWNEFIHEREREGAMKAYPDGIHSVIAGFLKSDDINITIATLDMPECGLTEEVVNNTDVLIWWGHIAHGRVPDEIADRVRNAVLKGMGIIFLHSAHNSKPFLKLLGSSGRLTWRESDDRLLLWVIDPTHPITQGIDRYIEIPKDETYAEPFDIPTPDELVFISWFEGGEVLRSGCCYRRGCGKIFYFQPGHETYPIYSQPEVQMIIKNAVNWAMPVMKVDKFECPPGPTPPAFEKK